MEIMVLKGKRFGEIVKELMESRGLRTSELARQIGMPQTTITRITTGHTENPSANTLLALAGFFNVSIPTLLGLDEPKNNFPQIERPKTPVEKIPVIKWTKVKQWFYDRETVVSEGISHWFNINRDISSNSFAVITDKASLRHIFPKGSILIIDPDVEYHENDYVFVSINKNLPAVRQISEESDSFYLNAVGLNIPADKLEPPHFVFGKIMGYYTSFF